MTNLLPLTAKFLMTSRGISISWYSCGKALWAAQVGVQNGSTPELPCGLVSCFYFYQLSQSLIKHPFKPQQPIKDKLLLSIYSQLCVVQYGEFGRWSLVGVSLLIYQFSQHSSYTLFNTGWENWGDDTWELRVNKQAASLDKTISPREESLFNSCFQMGAFLGLEKNGIVNTSSFNGFKNCSVELLSVHIIWKR